jgi:hypothetical protein
MSGFSEIRGAPSRPGSAIFLAVRGAGPKKAEPEVVRGYLPRALELAAGALAGLYLLALVLGTSGHDVLGPHLPETFEHFVRVPCLFPHAATDVIDYRLAAWSCTERQFRELDVRPYFPMHEDDKENRFQRLGFFFRRDAKVLGALDDWLTAAHDGPHADDGLSGPIGGIQLFSLRLPVPALGEMARWARPPLAELPDTVKKEWYRTVADLRAKRCTARDP